MEIIHFINLFKSVSNLNSNYFKTSKINRLSLERVNPLNPIALLTTP